MKIELSNTKGAVTFLEGSDLDIVQGEINLRTRILSSEVTLVDGQDEIDTTINLPAGTKVKAWKVEILTAGGNAVNITSLGQAQAVAAAANIADFSGSFALAQNSAAGTSAQGTVAAAGAAVLGAADIDLFMQHADPGANPPKVRVSIMIEEII